MFSTGNVLLCACFPHPPCSVGTALPVHSRDALFRPLPQPSPHSVPRAQPRSDAAEPLSLGGSPEEPPRQYFCSLDHQGHRRGFQDWVLSLLHPAISNAVADALEWYLRIAASVKYSTTWTTSSSSDRHTRRSAQEHWPPSTGPAPSSESQSLNTMGQPPA